MSLHPSRSSVLGKDVRSQARVGSSSLPTSTPRLRAIPCTAAYRQDAVPEVSRRATLAAGSALLLSPWVSLSLPCRQALAGASANVDWATVKQDVIDLISDPKIPGGIGNMGPTLVRLAWHSAGTYDKMAKNGGSEGGTMRFKEELMHGANAGLDGAVAYLEPIKKKHPEVTYSDLYSYAGAVSIEAMGGPHIQWQSGRKDYMDPSYVTPDGRLPDADYGAPDRTASGLRRVFGRMGFDDREIVCLSGAHALGRCHAEASGYVGPWTGTPTIFSNLYFKLLLKTTWTPDERQKKFQFKDPSGTLMMLPSDIVLTQDADFKQYVELYAKDKKLFYKDFAVAFQKLEELGCTDLTLVA